MTDSLLSRLQSLTSSSREIDAEIALANGWAEPFGGADPACGYWHAPDGTDHCHPPRYTESFDLALTLMPPGWHWNIDKDSNGFLILIYGNGKTVADVQGQHPRSAAIAVLIAIMKAKEESSP